MKITVAGVGYVGLSLATLLSQDNEVIAYDIDNIKIDLINKRISPIKDNGVILKILCITEFYGNSVFIYNIIFVISV